MRGGKKKGWSQTYGSQTKFCSVVFAYVHSFFLKLYLSVQCYIITQWHPPAGWACDNSHIYVSHQELSTTTVWCLFDGQFAYTNGLNVNIAFLLI